VVTPRVPARRVTSAYVIEIGLIALVSLLIWLLIGIGRPGFLHWRGLAFSLFVGLSIYSACRLSYRLWQSRVDRLPARQRVLAWGLVYFVGGCLGYVLGVPIGGRLFAVGLGRPGANDAIMLGILGGLATLIGLALHFHGLLQERLRQSVERLHEAEVAENELALARVIQLRLQPPAEIAGDGFRIAARNLPATYVAGDFYDVFRLADGALGVAVGDVSGKGMGAALIMAAVKSRLPLLAAGRSVTETLAALDASLLEELAPREFVALAYARLDPANGLLELGNAGLPDPYLLVAGAEPQILSVPGARLPLGLRAGVTRECLRVPLAPGARALLLTDGLPEALTAGGEPLGYEALAALVAGDGKTDISSWLDALVAAVEARAPGPRADDWTLLALERR
jgi:sigma-B regulation protein RsbU (phosphoserine phosphatase)